MEPPGGFDRARLLAARGNVDQALDAVDRLLSEEPRHLGALLLKAGLLLDSREEELALAVYRQAVEAAPRSAEAWNGLARCLHTLGDDARALELAGTARGLLGEGDNFRQAAPVYLTMVWCLRAQRRFKEALAVAEEGLSSMPDAILAQWAQVVEEELAEAEKEEC
jgi:tetratricopeptide (TPR) repeat protein